MAKYIIEIDERNSLAKSFINFIMNYAKHNSHCKIEKTPNNDTLDALIELKRKKIKPIKSKDELNVFFDSL